MQKKLCFWGVAKSFSDDSGPLRTQVVLRIAEIDKGKGSGLFARRAELNPLAPVVAIADSVDVICSWSQIGKLTCVAVGFLSLLL